jgi:outer membrane lipoprotein SlyB
MKMRALTSGVVGLTVLALLGGCAHNRSQPVVQDNAPVYSSSRYGDRDDGRYDERDGHRHRHDDRRYDDRRYDDRRYDDRRGYNAQFGVIRALDVVPASATTSGAGAAIGGVTGAVIGRQFGSKGDGRALGTALGLFAGVIIGNEIERSQSGGKGYTRVTVQLEGGGDRTFNLQQAAELRVGDRVRIENNQLYRY